MKESLTAASYQEPSLESFCDSLIREQDKLIHLGIINNVDTSGKALLSQQKKKSSLPRNRISAIISQAKRVPNPLSHLLLYKMTKDPRQKERRLSVIAIFMGKIIMMNLNVLRRWQPWKQQ